MASSYDDVYALCPYFRSSDKAKIVCEGITDCCTNTIGFTARRFRDEHRAKYCDKNYSQCKVNKMLEEKYR